MKRLKSVFLSFFAGIVLCFSAVGIYAACPPYIITNDGYICEFAGASGGGGVEVCAYICSKKCRHIPGLQQAPC